MKARLPGLSERGRVGKESPCRGRAMLVSLETLLSNSSGFSAISNFPLTFWVHLYVRKEMAAHSSILAWIIPWTEEPGRLLGHGVAELDTSE